MSSPNLAVLSSKSYLFENLFIYISFQISNFKFQIENCVCDFAFCLLTRSTSLRVNPEPAEWMSFDLK